MTYVTKCLYIYIRTFKIPTSNNRGIKFVFCGLLRVLLCSGQVLFRQEAVSTWLSITICAYTSACSPNTLNHQLSYSKTKCSIIKQFMLDYLHLYISGDIEKIEFEFTSETSMFFFTPILKLNFINYYHPTIQIKLKIKI